MTILQLPTARTAPTLAPLEHPRTAAWIAQHVFFGEVSAEWVLAHCPREQYSRKVVRFYEGRVRAWVANRQKAGAA